MRVALAALESHDGDVEGNLARLTAAVEEYEGWGIDVLVCGEMFAHGFGAATFDVEHDRAIAWEVDGPELGRVRRLARRAGMAVCLGFFERDGEHLHSSAIVIGRDGTTLAHYRRLSRGWRFGTEDPAVYQEGTGPVAFRLAGKACTIALCGDLWDAPERFAEVRPDVVLWPVHVSWSPQEWSAQQLDAYAVQANRVYASVLMVNNVTPAAGPDDTDDAVGGAAWFRNGKVKAALPCDGAPGVLVVDVL